MTETKHDWKVLIQKCEDAGVDGLELNFGCPHGMCERGMGSSVGQEPRLLQEITSWTKEFAKTPVLVKLTPNTGDILEPGLAGVRGGADGLSLINTIKSIIGVDLDRLVPVPRVANASTNGGYCGPAVKPIALHMVAALARDPGSGSPSRASAGSRRGATPPSSSPSARPACRCAPRSCTTAIASWRTSWRASPSISTARA